MLSQSQQGRLIGGRYTLTARLGGGGFARVWQGWDQILAVNVAIKEVRLPPLMSDIERAQRLRWAEREARNAARLRDHLNIVAVHDVVIEDDVPWIVMQLVEGCSLDQHIARFGPLSVRRAAHVARSLLYALGAAHSLGIVHRDVKPGNVLLADRGEVLLTDFGIAFGGEDGRAVTQEGIVIGSAEYIAPERMRGVEGQPAADLFSLGVTLYEAVRGFSPFRRASQAASSLAAMIEQPPPPRRAAALAPLVMGLLEKDPRRRLTVEQALALLDGQPIC